MKRIQLIAIVAAGLISILAYSVRAQKPTTLEQAKTISVQTHKLILLEFFRDD